MRHRIAARFMTAASLLLALSTIAVPPADARRGGSFGSRGSRTYAAPRPTYGSSSYVPPIERSMTARPQAQPGGAYSNPGFGQSQAYRPAGSRFGGLGGFGGGLIGGLVAGGLIGHFFGHGMGGGWGAGGGGGGMLAALLQIAILAGIVWLVVGFFRRRSGAQDGMARQSFDTPGVSPSVVSGPWNGTPSQTQGYDTPTTDIALTSRDQQDFERLLIDVQDAFGREDYARLRSLTTPEIMSFLSEELSQNATQGLRNEVSGTRLIDADVSEAWHEASGDYATIALRYEGVDVMRDRTTGAIVRGGSAMPTETTELWTFVRAPGDTWKLSAIQES